MAYDTIVIGLGAAGCTAVSTLAQAGKRVLGLEGQGRVGGRVHTVPFGDGVVELGAEWIHGQYPSRVFDAAVTNHIPVKNQHLNFEVYNSDGSKADTELVNDLIEYCFGVADDPPETPEPLGQYISRKLIDYVKTKHPHLSKSFIDSFLHFMDLFVDNLESSSSWNDVTTASKFQKIEGHQHASWHRYGFKTFFEILLNTYNNGPGYPTLEILVNKEVSQISWPQDPAQDVTVSCTDGTVYTARSVIITVSIGVLKERHQTMFSPNLPQHKAAAINNISIGVMDKVILTFDSAWWPSEATFCGFLWDVARVDEGWPARIFAASRPMGSGSAVTLWTSGETAKLVETLPEEEVKSKAMELLRRFMGRHTTVPEPTGIVRSLWYSNQYTRGSYSFDSLSAPQHPSARMDLAQPLTDSAGRPRVLFAGEASSPRHYSTVHGAADTGYREAMRLLMVPSKL